MLGSDAAADRSHAAPPVGILMVGLQGSGKTTTTAKIAYRLTNREQQEGADGVARHAPSGRAGAAARARRADGRRRHFRSSPGRRRCRSRAAPRMRASSAATTSSCSTPPAASTVDEELMDEVRDVKAAIPPARSLARCRRLTGQDAVNTAKAFDGRIGITGIVLTRADGDGRGGAALSMRAVTGKPIKLIGVGEKWDALEDFHPERIAVRILGMGDVVSLVEKAAQTIDVEKATKIAEKMKKGVVRPRGPVRSAEADAEARRHGRRARHAARRRARSRGRSTKPASTTSLVAPARHHLVDDAAGAPQSESPRRPAQAAHRGRLRHQGRGHQQAPQDAPPDGGHDEDRWARTAACSINSSAARAPGLPRPSCSRCRRSLRSSIPKPSSSSREELKEQVAKGLSGSGGSISGLGRGLPGLSGGLPRGLPGLGGGLPKFPGLPGKKK